MEVIFHRRIQKDLRAALAFYETEGGSRLADRFFTEAEDAVPRVLHNLQGFHFIEEEKRRVSLESFPYHFLFEENSRRVRFLVLRHDKRHPAFGLSRK